jgi:hypothetical protein
LLDLFGERRRRQAADDVVRFSHWADFDNMALFACFAVAIALLIRNFAFRLACGPQYCGTHRRRI